MGWYQPDPFGKLLPRLWEIHLFWAQRNVRLWKMTEEHGFLKSRNAVVSLMIWTLNKNFIDVLKCIRRPRVNMWDNLFQMALRWADVDRIVITNLNYLSACEIRTKKKHKKMNIFLNMIKDEADISTTPKMTKLSPVATLKVVILTIFSAASGESLIKMKTFPFQCTTSGTRTL